MMVRCCRTYEEVREGDVGKVVKLDRDGLHDLNVQSDWQHKGGTYWVRYIHVELLGEPACPGPDRPAPPRRPAAPRSPRSSPHFQATRPPASLPTSRSGTRCGSRPP